MDDDPIVLAVTGDLLTEQGYEVHRRDRALGTTAWILSERPDLVLLDLDMPGLGGEAILDVARDRMGATAPDFILHSSSPEAELGRIVRAHGALGFLAKDGDQQAFLSRLESLVRQRRRR